jgi:hypothetical protein
MVRHVRISPKHLLIVLLLTVPLLSACDPSGPAEPGSASINVELHADGEAEVVVKFPPDRNGLSLSMIGTQVSNSIFPSAAAVTTRVDDQGGAGFPLARSRVVGAYSPGNRPHLILDFHRAVEVLHAQHLASVDVGLDAPFVPSAAAWSVRPSDQADGSWHWHHLQARDAPVRGEVILKPQPLRAFGALTLLLLTLGSLGAGTVAIRARRRWLGVALGVLALVASVAAIADAAGAQGDNLGVAGLLSGSALRAMTLLPIVTIAGVPLGVTVAVVALAGARASGVAGSR